MSFGWRCGGRDKFQVEHAIILNEIYNKLNYEVAGKYVVSSVSTNTDVVSMTVRNEEDFM